MSATDLFTTVTAKPTPPPTVLRGPANADNFRQKVGRYSDRFYIDTLDTCDIADADPDWLGPSITVVKKAAGFGAAEFVVMDRMAQSDELEAIARQPKEKRYGRIKNLNDEGRDEAYARGRGIHTAAEQILYGEPVTLRAGEPGWDFLPALQAFFDAHQPTLVAAEVVCIHRDLNGRGYGGTTDAIVGIDGRIYGIDYKSRGKDHGAYPEEAAQIAAYLRAQYMLVEGPTGAQRQRLPDVDGGLIVSITKDSFEIHPIDLDKAFSHWTALHAWWIAKQVERETIGRKWAPRKIAAPISPESAPTGEGLSLSPSPVDEPLVGENVIVPPDLLVAVTDELRRAELRRRYNLLNDHDRAKFRGLMLDPDDLDLIETHLDGLDAFMNVHVPIQIDEPKYVVGAVSRTQTKVVPIPEPSLGVKVEGDLVPDAEWTTTARAFDALDATAKAWIKNIVAEAHEAQQWMSGAGGNRTTRRHQLLCGLVCLAAGGHDEDGFVRLVVSTVIDSDMPQMPTFPVGQVVGALTAPEAIRFNELCQAFCAGELVASVLPSGSMRLVAA